jgi:cell division protein FtsX
VRAQWPAGEAFVGQNIHVIVYLAEDVDQDRAQDLAEILRRVPTVAQVTTIEPATALARFTPRRARSAWRQGDRRP